MKSEGPLGALNLEAVQRYRRWLAQAELADATKRTYLGEVRSFADWLGRHARDREYDADDAARAVCDYVDWMVEERRRAPKGVETAVVAVRGLYRWLGLDVDRSLPLPPRDRTGLGSLAEAEAVAVRASADRRGPRDGAIVAVLLGAGLRLREIEDLNISDVRTSTGDPALSISAAQPRFVPIDQPTRASLDRWLRHRLRYPRAERTPALFLSHQGHRLAARSIRHVVAEVGQAADVHGLSPLVLRRACGVALARSGHDESSIAARLGLARDVSARAYVANAARDGEAARGP